MQLNETTLYKILNLNNLTLEQKQAITCQTPTLVCASAGSGKTFTLCNRILFKLLNPKNNLTGNDILIVSFTKSAADEIFIRIRAKLNNLVKKFPDELFFKKQLNSLNQNNITTIDSFCSNFLKENFEYSKLSPDFKITSEIEIFELKQKTITNIINQEYEKNPTYFQKLFDYFNLNSNDDLKKAVLKIFEKSRTNPFPKKFLKELTKPYENPYFLEQNTQMTAIIKQEIIDRIKHAQFLILSSKNYMDDPILKKNFEPVFEQTANDLNKLAIKLETLEFSKLNEEILNFKFKNLPRHNKKNNNFDLTLAEFIKSKFLNPAKKLINSIKLIQINNQQFIEDCTKQKPIIKTLVNLCFKFSQKLEQQKQINNSLEFSDLIIKTINLLTQPTENNNVEFKLTDLGKTIQNKFKEILIDEFQDINQSQELLFKILSKNNSNLFAVGDLKQSIYRFRQADPEIFLNYINNFKKNKKNLIYLKHNFRSHCEITNTINFLFGQIMSKNFGGIDYKSTETLISKCEFKTTKNNKTELHILKNEDDNFIDKNQMTMQHIAAQIKNLIESKFEISENGSLTACQPKHFAVLLRSDGQASNCLCQKLAKLNIPFCVNGTHQFLNIYEVSILISILKIIDNPLDDIAFCAVCLSPLFNFSIKKLHEIKTTTKQTSLFLSFTNSSNEKCAEFLKIMFNFRKDATKMPPSQLIQNIFYSEFFSKLIFKNLTESRQILNNLQNFLEFINNFEQNNLDFSLKKLLTILQTAKDFDLNFNSNQNNTLTQQNAVTIMTIHKSKGLQFPIVFVPLCEKKFNEQDLHTPIIISNKFGIGLKISNSKNLTRYNTLQFNCISINEKNQSKSEELRLLYVAMTRAQHKLFLIAADNENKFKNLILPKEQILPPSFCRNKTCFYDWLLAGFFRHKNAYFNKPKIEFKEKEFDCNISIKLIKTKFSVEQNTNLQTESKKSNNSEIDLNLIQTLKQNINFQNKPNELCKIPAKMSVTEITKSKNDLTLKNLSFEKTSTPAEIGTAMHCFLQNVNFTEAKLNLENEIFRLIQQKFISKNQADCLNKKQIINFLNSDIFNLIQNADSIERERNFIFTMPLNKLYKNYSISNNKNIIIQGAIDLLLENNNKLTIIDYKTDKTTNANIKKMYTNQIKLYKIAIEQLTKKPVTLCLIYSFDSNSCIKI